ncbi:caspase-8-like [Pecten maximus]|uniref:caspase-8-like n=1 Tax=Pecten maximus TaxID=6579 RepID=UPI0014587A25|nr:caspase-8-like [Pecten maximus]XP_033754756.1 caspase-8-like [Pecten maximus]
MSENMDGRGDCPPQQTREEFDSKTYSENVKFVGRALVVNNDQFRGSGNNPSPERRGSTIDFDAVIALLKDLGFAESHIESHQNLTKGQLKEIIEEAAGYEYNDFGCFVCVIMSFGEPGIIICPGEDGKEDERCEIKDIQAPFTGDKCSKLATKPKIYFIMGNSNYLEKHGRDGRDEEKPSIKLETKKIPRECNFITQFSEGTDQGKILFIYKPKGHPITFQD